LLKKIAVAHANLILNNLNNRSGEQILAMAAASAERQDFEAGLFGGPA